MVKWLTSLGAALFVFVVDRITKIWVLKKLSVHSFVKINDFLNVVHVTNKGGLWGIGNHRGGTFFVVASILAIVVVLALLKRQRDGDVLSSLAFGFILGGGMGNLVDRLLYGSVIDFIDVHYKGWHWPAFNFADAFIVVGIIMLVLFYRPERSGSG
ncbi:MAG: signal peptidase II [Deferribacteres bacterium]|nr:signal peptidase II [Deferribacteres bacterium]